MESIKIKKVILGFEIEEVLIDLTHVNHGGGETRKTQFTAQDILNELIHVTDLIEKHELERCPKVINNVIYVYTLEFNSQYNNKNHFMKFAIHADDKVTVVVTMFRKRKKKQ